MTKTYLYKFDPIKPHFYIVKLGLTGVYFIFHISAQKHILWVLVRTALLRVPKIYVLAGIEAGIETRQTRFVYTAVSFKTNVPLQICRFRYPGNFAINKQSRPEAPEKRDDEQITTKQTPHMKQPAHKVKLQQRNRLGTASRLYLINPDKVTWQPK